MLQPPQPVEAAGAQAHGVEHDPLDRLLPAERDNLPAGLHQVGPVRRLASEELVARADGEHRPAIPEARGSAPEQSPTPEIVSHPPVCAPDRQNHPWERLTHPLCPWAAGISAPEGLPEDEQVLNKHSSQKYMKLTGEGARPAPGSEAELESLQPGRPHKTGQ